jgi:hypothetical protein
LGQRRTLLKPLIKKRQPKMTLRIVSVILIRFEFSKMLLRSMLSKK